MKLCFGLLEERVVNGKQVATIETVRTIKTVGRVRTDCAGQHDVTMEQGGGM